MQMISHRMKRNKIMNVDARIVKELRDKTGAGMMDCKKALTESEGDIEKAIDYLRKTWNFSILWEKTRVFSDVDVPYAFVLSYHKCVYVQLQAIYRFTLSFRSYCDIFNSNNSVLHKP